MREPSPSDSVTTAEDDAIPREFMFEGDMTGSTLTIQARKRTASEASFKSRDSAVGKKLMDRDCASDWTSEYDAVSGGDPSEGERSDTSHSREEPNPAIFPSVDAEEWAQTVQIVRYAVQSDIPSDQDKGIIITLYKAIIAADPAVPKSAEKVVLLPSRSVPLLMKQCIALTYDNYAGDKGKQDYKALCEVFNAKTQPGEIKTVTAP